MYRVVVIALLTVLFVQSTHGQTSENQDTIRGYATQNATGLLEGLPDGIYMTGESFQQKVPDRQDELKVERKYASQRFVIRHAASSKKVKKAFAIVHQGEVFFQPKQIMNMLVKDSHGQLTEKVKSYIKARVNGQYLYMEAPFTTMEAVVLGGAIGAAAANRDKAIIYINHLNKFRVIKNLDHLVEFIQAKHPEYAHLAPSADHIEETYSGPHIEPSECEYVRHILGQMEE